MKKLLKSNLSSYIFCFGILITIIYFLSIIDTQAATLNAIATSTKEACNSSNISTINNESNYCNIPAVNKTVNKYVSIISTIKSQMAESITNLSSVRFIKNTFGQAKNHLINILTLQKNKLICLGELFVVLLMAQIYYKKNTIKALIKLNNIFIKPINIIKNKIHIFNLKILKLIQEDEKGEIHVNLKKLLSEKAKVKFYNNKSLIMKFLVLKMLIQTKVIYIDSILLSTIEQQSVNNRGRPLKLYNLVNSS